jgi:hypothetical protein
MLVRRDESHQSAARFVGRILQVTQIQNQEESFVFRAFMILLTFSLIPETKLLPPKGGRFGKRLKVA